MAELPRRSYRRVAAAVIVYAVVAVAVCVGIEILLGWTAYAIALTVACVGGFVNAWRAMGRWGRP